MPWKHNKTTMMQEVGESQWHHGIKTNLQTQFATQRQPMKQKQQIKQKQLIIVENHYITLYVIVVVWSHFSNIVILSVWTRIIY
jgi:flagellar biosynthesis component FlhA